MINYNYQEIKGVIIMSITSMIGELFRPVSNIVDELHTSEEEKFKIKKRNGQVGVRCPNSHVGR